MKTQKEMIQILQKTEQRLYLELRECENFLIEAVNKFVRGKNTNTIGQLHIRNNFYHAAFNRHKSVKDLLEGMDIDIVYKADNSRIRLKNENISEIGNIIACSINL